MNQGEWFVKLIRSVMVVMLLAIGMTSINIGRWEYQPTVASSHHGNEASQKNGNHKLEILDDSRITLYVVPMAIMRGPLSRIPVYTEGAVTYLPSRFLAQRAQGSQQYLDDPAWVVAYYCSNLIPEQMHVSAAMWSGNQYRLTTAAGLSIVEITRPADSRKANVQMVVPNWGRYDVALMAPPSSEGAYIIQRITYTPCISLPPLLK